jgi:hypothetical protein
MAPPTRIHRPAIYEFWRSRFEEATQGFYPQAARKYDDPPHLQEIYSPPDDPPTVTQLVSAGRTLLERRTFWVGRQRWTRRYKRVYPWPDDFIVDALGDIPGMIDVDCMTRTPAGQFAKNHVGGWDALEGARLIRPSGAVKFGDDPLMIPFASLYFGGQTIHVYPFDWVACIDSGDAFEGLANIPSDRTINRFI